MARSALSICAVAVAVGLLPAALVGANTGEGAAGARAGAVGRASASEPPARSAPDDALDGWIDVVPPQCAPFAAGVLTPGAERPTSEHAWRQLLSLAACVQDSLVRTGLDAVTEPEQLAPMVDELSRRLALPMMIYLDALAHADAPIQLRAAFQIGTAYVALCTRARSSIAPPPELAARPDPARPDPARRYRELHARLEPLLHTARRAAFISFRAIVEAAEEDPALVRDEVERNIVAAARQLLPALRDASDEERTLMAAAR
jgi:hypothetical protein